MKAIENKEGLFNVEDKGNMFLALADTPEEALAKYQEALSFEESAEEKEEARQEAIATKYQQDRQYPPIGDQLDALFHAGVFPQEMADKIQAVKDAHPKP